MSEILVKNWRTVLLYTKTKKFLLHISRYTGHKWLMVDNKLNYELAMFLLSSSSLEVSFLSALCFLT